jgi:hypothetical protein
MTSTSTGATSSVQDRWMDPDEFGATGFKSIAPETDYGYRWGAQQTIRVSFAPTNDAGDGYLYAYDLLTKRSLMLAEHTTWEAVEQASTLLTDMNIVDGHLALAAVINDDRPLTPEHAGALWLHCIEREVHSRHAYATSDLSSRMAAAGAVIVNESARCAAERVMLRAHVAHHEDPPVVVRYRVVEWPSWSGRYASANLDQAADRAREFQQAAERVDYTFQALSVSCGVSIVAAARVPELSFASPVAQISPDFGPRI